MAATTPTPFETLRLRRIVLVAALLNLGYFFVEFGVARAIGSVSLFADSIDFLEDTCVNLVVLLALGWSAAKRRLVGLFLAALLLVPSAAALWTIVEKLRDPTIADPWLLSATGFGALLVNTCCAVMLAQVRNVGGSLSKAAFLSARNDTVANVGIIAAGALTFLTGTIWPDLVVGLGIALLNADAAMEVYEAAVRETDGPHEQHERA